MRSEVNQEILAINNNSKEYKSLLVTLNSDFTKINKEISDMHQKQSYGENDWYPKVVNKLKKWYEAVADEKVSRDLVR